MEGSFVLRSGQQATDYFDKYQFESRPDLLRDIARALVPLIPADTEILAGLELGGVPVATALSLEVGLPAVFVRKVAKEYGTAKLAEGPDIDGRKLLVVEDVVTSGGQVIASTADLRARGAVVTAALCVIDREQGGSAALDAQNIGLTSLLTRSLLDDA